MPLSQSDFSQIRKILRGELKNYPTREEIQKEFKEVNKKLDLAISFFDREYLQLRARVDRIEKFLKIPPLSA